MRSDRKSLSTAALLAVMLGVFAGAQEPATPNSGPTADRAPTKVEDPLIAKPGVEAGIASLTTEEFAEQLAWWAHDDRGGREPGTPGSVEAGDVAAQEFARLGLEPFGDLIDGKRSYFQYFENGGRHAYAADTALTIGGKPCTLGTDYVVRGSFNKASLEDLDVVFAGYGIRSRRPKRNDYDGIDAGGKAVLVFAGADGAGRSGRLTMKALTARRAKAKLLIITGVPKGDDPKADVLPLDDVMRSGSCPVLYVKPSVAAGLLAGSDETLESLRDKLAAGKAPSAITLHTKVSFSGKRELVAKARNIIARFPGSDPKLADEALIIGAHYDHLGIGRFGSRSPKRLGEVHNGADDNATGAVGVLELAEAFAESGVTTKRSIVFILFDAEEKGLLGARHYVEHPTVPRDKIAAMMNMDMIGRVDPKRRRMTVGGTGTCKEWKEICTIAAIGSPLEWKQNPSAFGGSDHLPFVQKKIPVLMFNSGVHNDYHTPDDDADRCNPEGARDILRGMFRMAYQAANLDAKPQWLDARPRGRLGIRTRSVKEGARIAYIDADTPAQIAGLKLDDVITKINGQKVRTRYSISRALRKVKPGEMFVVEFQRGGEPMPPLKIRIPKPGEKPAEKAAPPKPKDKRELR